ncbi:hypothetical protein HYC85_017473 [Camellia sinensis]|uniref:Uncharacterized protein n=1 Tax=Camellia sinensis TaxID=4442 RepID=A0A7J7GV66_CAMSI|nr:hypothetical protein HYC85_017473 [Camellia sinensis]
MQVESNNVLGRNGIPPAKEVSNWMLERIVEETKMEVFRAEVVREILGGRLKGAHRQRICRTSDTSVARHSTVGDHHTRFRSRPAITHRRRSKHDLPPQPLPPLHNRQLAVASVICNCFFKLKGPTSKEKDSVAWSRRRLHRNHPRHFSLGWFEYSQESGALAYKGDPNGNM